MAKVRKQKQKVFKTPIGFHDAYVAAPSRKAALAAWGAGTDLFSAGIAEEVKDGSEAANRALASPGEVVRERRSGGKEDRPSQSLPARRSAGKRRKPSRTAVERAESALAALAEKQTAERAELAKQEEQLAKRRRALDQRHAKAANKAQAKLEEAEERYRRAMRAWGG